ncbi:MAG: endonuclease III [Phycisphaerae bacterium]|nr:endonuclease III [Phycisphaerae bacterium]
MFEPTRRRVRAITRRLEKAHGPRPWDPEGDPLGGLIATILSQHTSDTNSHAAYAELRRRFPTWESVLGATPRQIEQAIRQGGLAKQKSVRIKAILAEIRDEHGRLGLDFLAHWPIDRAVEYLCRFNGVGRKTAACVLMFELGRPVLPVDTHVHRLAKRLGLIAPDTSADQAHDALQAICPDELVWPFHVLLVTHGRRICKAREPECGACSLRDICPTGIRAGWDEC